MALAWVRMTTSLRLNLRRLAPLLAILLALVAQAPGHDAAAQQNPIVGAWGKSDYDRFGRPWLTGYLQFFPNGALRLKVFYVGGPQPWEGTGSYRLDRSGTTVQMVFTAYVPIGQPLVRGIQFQGPNTLVFSDGAAYTRAPGVP